MTTTTTPTADVVERYAAAHAALEACRATIRDSSNEAERLAHQGPGAVREPMARRRQAEAVLFDRECTERRLRAERDEAEARAARQRLEESLPELRRIRAQLIASLSLSATINGRGIDQERANRERGAAQLDGGTFRAAADAIAAALDAVKRIGGGAA